MKGISREEGSCAMETGAEESVVYRDYQGDYVSQHPFLNHQDVSCLG